MIYVYPKLPAKKTYPFFRIAGNGLANCLFIYARAICLARKVGARIITPTWFNLTIGPYLRHQSDKRHYLGLFNSKDEIKGFKKLCLLFTKKQIKEQDSEQVVDNAIVVVSGLNDFFSPIINDSKLVNKYFIDHIVPSAIQSIHSFDFSKCIAVHIRLGDYTIERRVPLKWYIEKIKEHQVNYPESRFLVFSDGNDNELRDVLSLPSVERVFFGNAIADIIAISRCQYLIGSDSTFSAWGAYLGQVPCLFYRQKVTPILSDYSREKIEIVNEG